MMRYALTQTVAPATEPITTAEAKSQVRVDTADEDTHIDGDIVAARTYCETFTGRQFVTATFEYKIDAFPVRDVIYLPKPPLQSVSSITYVDTDGVVQTWSSAKYNVDVDSIVGRIEPAYGETWPSPREQHNAVTITFVAGFGAASAVPGPIKKAMKLLVGHWFENREAVTNGRIEEVPLAVKSLLWSQRVPQVA